MDGKPSSERPTTLFNALARTVVGSSVGAVLAVGLGPAAALVLCGLFAGTPGSDRTQQGIAMMFGMLTVFVTCLIAPALVAAQIVRDRMSGMFDLARAIEASPGRRLAAYVFGPAWLPMLAIVVAALVLAPAACVHDVSAGAWFGVALGALVFQGVASLFAALVALMNPRAHLNAQAQGLGVCVPIGLTVLASIVAANTAPGERLLAAALVVVAGAVPFWRVAHALVEQPERTTYPRVAAISTFVTGGTLAALMGPRAWNSRHPVEFLALWAVAVSVATALWTLPRGEQLARAIRRGAGDHASRAVGVALASSLVFAAITALAPSQLRGASSVGVTLDGAALVAMLSVGITALVVLVKSASRARRGAVVWGVLAGLCVVAMLEGAALYSGSALVAQIDPFATLWSRGSGGAFRFVVQVAVTVAMALVARRAWRQAVERLAVPADGSVT